MKKIEFEDKIDVVEKIGPENQWLTSENVNEIKKIVNENAVEFDAFKANYETFKTNYETWKASVIHDFETVNTNIQNTNTKINKNTTDINALQSAVNKWPYGFAQENETFSWQWKNATQNVVGEVTWKKDEVNFKNLAVRTERTTFSNQDLVTKKYVDDKQTTSGSFDATKYISRAQWVTAATDAIAKQKWTSPEHETLAGTNFDNSKATVFSGGEPFKRAESIVFRDTINNEQATIDLENILLNTETVIKTHYINGAGSTQGGWTIHGEWVVKKTIYQGRLDHFYVAYREHYHYSDSSGTTNNNYTYKKRKFKITFKQDIVSYLLEKINNL